MSKEILKKFINDFEFNDLERFFRTKTTSFSPSKENLNQYDDENFKRFNKFGEIEFKNQIEKSIIVTSHIQKDLTERSGKKAQYKKAKKILKDLNAYDAGIFIFYDNDKNFRFSLVYEQPIGTRRVFSNFKRFTYYVSRKRELTNKTFLSQIGEADFSSIDKIKEAFSVEPVTKQFYGELQTWYFWATDKVEFPDDEDKNGEIRNAKNLIRLITRIIFVWFMKVKGLIPETLFDKNFIDKILDYKDKTNSTYYKAILQNLFFATLNTQMKKDDSKSRSFIDEAKKKGFISDGYLQQGYYRYKRFIKNTVLFLEQFKNIPFLNGGLFDCLDKRVGSKEIRIDCFSDNPRNEGRLKIPDELFFSEKEIDVDLRKHLDPNSKKPVIKKVRGLLAILKSYNFTIDENTPVDKEIALDPELLGKVFENLLASYSPETRTTTRKATGSYYTPREIVEYMVDESLIAYLKTALSDNTKDLEDKLRSLLNYNSEINPFENEKGAIRKIIDAIKKIKILDPACGSSAFPMGILHKLVLILHKLDPDNSYWKKLLLEKVPVEIREETEQSLKNKPLDYIRKLGLIEHCIYGVDIQEIAIQISKLRFFISLLVEQEPDDNKPNRDIKSLPNLETKFVATNTLIGLEKLPEELFDSEVKEIIKELFKIREDFFYANSRWKKKELKRKEEKLKETLIESIQKSVQKINKEKIQKLKTEIERLNKEFDNLVGQPDEIEVVEIPNLFGEKETKTINKTQERRQKIKRSKFSCENELDKLENPRKEPSIEIAEKIASFNPYDQNKSNSWFDPEWMFGVKDGFDIVIANPPYVRHGDIKEQKPFLQKDSYEVYNSTSDLYTYFYEKAWQISKPNGFICFISSNKWMRAKYGEKLRKFFKEKTTLKQIIDFNGYQVFDATVDTNILLFQKTKPSESIVHILNIQPDFTPSTDITTYFNSHRLEMKQSEIDSNCFTFADETVMNLKKKIEERGIPLKNWDVKIYRGVTTGFNKAFIIDTTTKENLCQENSKSGEILKPILRGRDVNKWFYEFKGFYLIYTYTGIDIKKYPAIYEYLKQYKSKLGQVWEAKYGKKKWYELRGCDYYDEFEKEKIIWADINTKNSFTFDNMKHFLSNTGYILVGNNIKYLLAFLNSSIHNFYFRQISQNLGEKGYRYINEFIEQLPIPKIPESAQKPLIEIVDKILALTKSDGYSENSSKQANVREYEHQIDQMVYKLYGLTKEEIEVVENSNKKF